MSAPVLTRIADGVYRVEHDGSTHVVYVAATAGDAWVFWDGRVFHRAAAPTRRARGSAADTGRQALTAPMPATVLRVLVAPGDPVARGATLVILEAMKMEMPIRADADATVTAVLCAEGDLVQPGATLVTLA